MSFHSKKRKIKKYENNNKETFLLASLITYSYYSYYSLEFDYYAAKKSEMFIKWSVDGRVVKTFSLRENSPEEHGFEPRSAHYFFILIITFGLLLIIQPISFYSCIFPYKFPSI